MAVSCTLTAIFSVQVREEAFGKDAVQRIMRVMQLMQILLGAIVGLGSITGIAAAQIKIGAAEALTGNAAQYGAPIRKGFELALGEINGSGGIHGQKIELIIEDEQGKKEEEKKEE